MLSAFCALRRSAQLCFIRRRDVVHCLHQLIMSVLELWLHAATSPLVLLQGSYESWNVRKSF